MRARALLMIAFTLVALPSAARVNPRLKDVHKIYVRSFSAVTNDDVTLDKGSPENVYRKVVASLVSSGRFAVVKDEAKADAALEGTAGYFKSEKNGETYSNGYAHLELVDSKSKELIWTFDYKRHAAVGGYASDRVATQFIEKLLADAKTADGR